MYEDEWHIKCDILQLFQLVLSLSWNKIRFFEIYLNVYLLNFFVFFIFILFPIFFDNVSVD